MIKILEGLHEDPRNWPNPPQDEEDGEYASHEAHFHKNLDVYLAVCAWLVTCGWLVTLFFVKDWHILLSLYISIPIWVLFVALTVIYRRRPLSAIGWVFFSVLPYLWLWWAITFVAPAMRPL